MKSMLNLAKREHIQWFLDTQAQADDGMRAAGLAQMLRLYGKTELRTLLIDMDDVVAELLKYCCAQHKVETGIEIDHLSIEEWLPGNNHLSQIWDRPGTFELLEVTQDAQEALAQLHEDGFEIFFLTAPPTMHSVQEKLAWVDKHFPFLGWRRVIPTDQKHRFDGDLLLDDSPKNLASYDRGLRIAWDRKYNRDAKAHSRVHGWREFHRLAVIIRSCM